MTRIGNKESLSWVLPALICLSIFGTVHSAFGQTPEPAPELFDVAALEAFFDGLMAVHLASTHVAGATVSVVKDGEIIFAKGYGYADVEARTPVSAEKTLFRVGSISKLFTWTAVMQAVEQGRLDLDTDINTYLDEFKIPETYPKPITMSHLMTHTPGFEDRMIALFARDASRIGPLGEVLKADFPERVRPPGQLSSYSNHGSALAAHIVELVSGMSWDDYAEQNILRLLKMNDTTTRQPVPDRLVEQLSTGYTYVDGKHVAGEFEFIPVGPAGAVSSTATDMAKFMIAHLQMGRYGDARIFGEETARQMQSRLFSYDPRISGVAHGFLEANINGHRMIGHGGDTLLFHSFLGLLPEQNVGMFISHNTAVPEMVPIDVFVAFMDRYFPAAEAPPTAPSPEYAEGAGRFAGWYGMARYDHTQLAKIMRLAMSPKITSEPDGTLVVPLGPFGTLRLVQIEPLLFQEIGGDERILFIEDEEGNISHAVADNFPFMPLEKLKPHESPPLHFAIAGLAPLVFLSAVIGWPIGAWRRRKRGGSEKAEDSGRGGLARLLAWLSSVLFLSFIVGFIVSLSDPMAIAFEVPESLNIVLWLPLIALAPLAGTLMCTWLAWRHGYWRFRSRVHYTLVAAASIAFVWFLYFWNMLGFNYTSAL